MKYKIGFIQTKCYNMKYYFINYVYSKQILKCIYIKNNLYIII